MPPHHQLNCIAPSALRVLRSQSNCLSSIVPTTSGFSLDVTPPLTTAPRHFSSSATQMTDLKASEPIYILGVGNLGKLFGHALTTSPSPSPVTILTHRPSLPHAFHKSSRSISMLREGVTTSTPRGSISIVPISHHDTAPIKHLIVTTKAGVTASAIKPLLSRLGPSSTILFTQNGMGIIESVNSLCFPDPATRPTYLTAIVVHGVFNSGPFSATHAGVGDMKIGLTSPSSTSPSIPPVAQALLDKILAAEALVAKAVDPQELVAAQLEKLIANACINPLTVLFRVPNEGLLTPLIAPLRHILCLEAASVFLPYLTSLGYLPPRGADERECELEKRFDAKRLRWIVACVNRKTRKNKSSMLQDFEAGRETEVRYINGWIAEKGKEYGVDCSTHEKLVELVEAGKEVRMEDIGSVFEKVGQEGMEKSQEVLEKRERMRGWERSQELFGFLKE